MVREEDDDTWITLGLAAPARRALLQAGIISTADLSRFTIEELGEMHGVGPTALRILAPYAGG